MGKILRNLGWLLGSRGINAVLSLIYLALATRTLGPEHFGHFALIVVMAQMLAGLVTFNGWQAIVRWGMEPGEVSAVAGFALALDLASIIAGTFLAAAFVWLAPMWLPLPPELRTSAFLLCVTSIASIRSTPTGVLRLRDRYDLASIAEAVLPMVRALGASAVTILWPCVSGFVATWAMAELACATAYWYFARRLIPLGLEDIDLRDFPRRHVGVWSFVLATNLSRTLAVTAKQMILLVVGALGGAALAGGYRVASQLGQALVQLGEAVSRAIYPELLRTSDAAPQFAGRMSALALGAGILAVGVSALGGERVITLLAGEHFAFAYPAMVILSLAGACELLGSSWESLLVARKRVFLPFVLRALPLALAMMLMEPAVAHWGITGAAFCMLVSSLVTVAGLLMGGLVERRQAITNSKAHVIR